MQPKLSPLTGKNLIATCPSDSHGKSPTRQSTGRCAIKPRSAGDFYVSPFIFRFMQDRIYSSASPFSSVFPLGFWPCGGLRLGLVRFFKPFRPLALAQQALVAIILQVLRRFRGAALFRSVRPSSTWGFPFWPMGLTVQSSRPAFCGRLTFGR